MSHIINQIYPNELLQSSYDKLFAQKNESRISPTKLSDFTLFASPIDNVDRVLLESYNLKLMREWHFLLTHDKESDLAKNLKSNKYKLTILTFLGTLYFACEGFDGMTALLGIFSLPGTLLMAAGILFSILSVIIFYSFDLVEISKNLEVSWQQTPKLIDLYVDQLEEMKALIKAISRQNNLDTLDDSDKAICIDWLKQLEMQYNNIAQQCIFLQNELDRPIINTAETAVTCLAGLIHFSGGFFAGQTVMISVCTALSISTSPTFLPILAFSLLVGIAALSIYWYVEKPGIEKFVSRWVGIDKEKLEKLEKPGRIDDKLDDIKTVKRALGLFDHAANDVDIRNRPMDTTPQSLHIKG